MFKVGMPIVYRAHQTLKTETAPHPENPGETIETQVPDGGSVHHPELDRFAGLITRTYDDKTADLVFFPPNREPKHADKVPFGEGEHFWDFFHGQQEPESRPVPVEQNT